MPAASSWVMIAIFTLYDDRYGHSKPHGILSLLRRGSAAQAACLAQSGAFSAAPPAMLKNYVSGKGSSTGQAKRFCLTD